MLRTLVLATTLLIGTTLPALAVNPAWSVITPASNALDPLKKKVHTNFFRVVPGVVKGAAVIYPSGNFETPASLACIYGVTVKTTGCNTTTLRLLAQGGTRAIAIVDAYHAPTALFDLRMFSGIYGLPEPNLTIVFASGTQPAVDPTGDWEVEEDLDIEAVHALAPNAQIFLVEAATSNDSDLLAAVKVAGNLVAQAGGGVVSMSWGQPERANEVLDEPYYPNQSTVTYVASSGDVPGISFPAVFPNVISVGGTTINRSNGIYVGQQTWAQAGGGASAYIGRPSFQSKLINTVGIYRGTPDVALDANPVTGMWMYDSYPNSEIATGWSGIGGTSLSAPLFAAILDDWGYFSGTTASLNALYATPNTRLTDLTSGTCGVNGALSAGVGYDLCTGLGAPSQVASTLVVSSDAQSYINERSAILDAALAVVQAANGSSDTYLYGVTEAQVATSGYLASGYVNGSTILDPHGAPLGSFYVLGGGPLQLVFNSVSQATCKTLLMVTDWGAWGTPYGVGANGNGTYGYQMPTTAQATSWCNKTGNANVVTLE